MWSGQLIGKRAQDCGNSTVLVVCGVLSIIAAMTDGSSEDLSNTVLVGFCKHLESARMYARGMQT